MKNEYFLEIKKTFFNTNMTYIPYYIYRLQTVLKYIRYIILCPIGKID